MGKGSVKKNTPKRGEKKELKETVAAQKRETPSRRKRVISSDEVFVEEETLDKGKKEDKLVKKVMSEEKEEESKTKAKPKRGKRGMVENEETEQNGSQVRKRVASSGAGSSPKKARVAPTKGTRSSPRKKALKDTTNSD